MNPDEAVALANAKYREAVEVETLIYEEAVRKATEAQRTYIERIQLLSRDLAFWLQDIHEGDTHREDSE